MRIEGRAALDHAAYRRLVWVTGKRRILTLLAVAFLIWAGATLLEPSVGVASLIALVILLPLYFELLLRRVWRRLAAGGSAVEIGYEVDDEGMRVSVGGVSTQHLWESVRPLRGSESYWLFRSILTRRPIAVPRSAFSAAARAEFDAALARLR